MENIRIINTKDENDFFDIPWEWLASGTQGPVLNDLEASAERSKMTGKLVRVRCAEIPSATLNIIGRHTQEELFPLFKLLRKVEIYMRYFEKYENAIVTKRFYAQKPNPSIYQYPEDNDTNKIIYEPFTIDFAGYEDINT